MPPRQEDINNPGQGLSQYSTWNNSKVNPVLWFFLLFLNALYTLIGVRLRDLRPNGACELNVNRTIGRVEHFDRMGLYWGLWSIYPGISSIILLVQISCQVVRYCKDSKISQRQQQINARNQGNQENQVEQGDRRYESNPTNQGYRGDENDPTNQVDARNERDPTHRRDKSKPTHGGDQRDEINPIILRDQRDENNPISPGEQGDKSNPTDRGDQGDESNPTNPGDRREENHLTNRGDQGDESNPTNQGDESNPRNQADRRNESVQREEGVQVDQGGSGIQNVFEFLHIVLVNILVILSGSLYIAADNFFFLVDPDDQSQNPSTTRSFIAGSSLIVSVLVFVVDYCFEHIVEKGLKTFNFVKESTNKPKNKDDALNVIRILYFWSPLAVVITTFDSLFISVVDEVSGEEEVRSGFDCSNGIGLEGAKGFFIVICIVFSITIVLFVLYKLVINCQHLPKGSTCSSSWNNCCCFFAYFWYIVHFLFIGIVFIITGLMFIAADNNWPWICFAKNADNICYWVRVRVGLLAAVTGLSFLFFASSIVLSPTKCYLKLGVNFAEVIKSIKCVRSGTAIDQTNAAASGTEIETRNTDTEEHTSDTIDGTNAAASGIEIQTRNTDTEVHKVDAINRTNAAASGIEIETRNTDTEEHTSDAINRTNAAASGIEIQTRNTDTEVHKVDAINKTNAAASGIEMERLNTDREEGIVDGVESPNGDNQMEESSSFTDSGTKC